MFLRKKLYLGADSGENRSIPAGLKSLLLKNTVDSCHSTALISQDWSFSRYVEDYSQCMKPVGFSLVTLFKNFKVVSLL